jgi:hypothetical protein
MNARSLGHKRLLVVVRNPTFYFLFILLLTACSASSSTMTTSQSSSQTESTNHPPVILHVEERSEIQNGRLLISKDIYFTDADGDATTVVNRLVSTDPADMSISLADDSIAVPADEQKEEALVTSAMTCPSTLSPFSLTVEDRIRDAPGNLSGPVTVVFSCPASPPTSAPFVIAALVIGFGLMTGFWLYIRKHPSEGSQTILSTVLLFCTLFPMYFMGMILHEGGHALANLMMGGTFKFLYVHPFAFSGFARPLNDNTWVHAGGYIANLLASFVIFSLLWKRRSITNLPFVMIFPFWAISQGLLISLLNGDTANILRFTGLPAILFIVLGVILICSGFIFLLALLPLLGLAPTDRRSLLVVPAAFFLHGAVSMFIAHVFVPGSLIDNRYLLGADILESANTLVLVLPIIGAFLAVLYLTLFHWIFPRLPAWVRTETARLTWNDVRIPGLLCVVSMIIGLIIIT